MENMIDTMRKIPDFVGSTGRTANDIASAGLSLGVSFANDYRQYLSHIGLACFAGHELTGLTSMMRLDVVAVTQDQRRQNGRIPQSWYVVEQTNIDGIVIWQDGSGEVYQTSPNCNGAKIADSLLEYIKQCTMQ